MSSMIPPAGYSIPIPTGSAPDYTKLIQNDPFYKQQLAWMEQDAATKRARELEDRQLAEQLYQLNVQQANNSANSGGDYGLAAAQAAAAHQKEIAAHDDKLREEQIREILASRGMKDSGQLQFEQQERQYDLNSLLKGIDLDLSAREAAIAESRSRAQASLALQLQEMQLRHNASMKSSDRFLEDLTSGLARDKGSSALSTYERLLRSGALDAPTMMAEWDPASGLYRTADGRYFDANKNPVNWSPVSSGGGGGDVPGPPPIPAGANHPPELTPFFHDPYAI